MFKPVKAKQNKKTRLTDIKYIYIYIYIYIYMLDNGYYH